VIGEAALEGLRVLDLTQVMAGPFCCQLLADLGAHVTKVEPVGSGDATRHAMGVRMKGEDNASFLAVNRGKESIAVDLKTEPGRQIFCRLAAGADVVVENFRPGVTKRLGIDYETVRELNPRLIYASISGFGQTGPYASRTGYDLIAQAMAGVMSVTGEPGGEPVKCGIPISDLGAGLFATVGILAAYIAREESGSGQHVDCSLFESALALSVWEATEFWSTGRVPQPYGSAHRFSAPYQALRTSDGHITVGANNQRLWERLCRSIGREDLARDERFIANADRMRNREPLVAELEATLRGRTTADWVDVLTAAGVPCGPIRNYQEVFDDPHTRARKMTIEMDHPVEGRIMGLGVPIKMSGTPARVRGAAPLLGQHTDEVLARVGYSAEEIIALRDAKVVG
jgi:crotonobetainyl-CoA:carnitine CoA-transferase CaiB-like acyl-CoA transferase